MPDYAWRAVAASGKVVEGRQTAPSEAQVLKHCLL